jgi:hypothetical protein
MLSTKSFVVNQANDAPWSAAAARRQTAGETIEVTVTPEAAIRFSGRPFSVTTFSGAVRHASTGIDRSKARFISECGQIRPKRSDRARQIPGEAFFVNDVAKIAIIATFSHTIGPNKNRFQAATS